MLLHDPNSTGRSRHGEPVRQSQRTALTTRRWLIEGRPAVNRFSGGSKGLRIAHSSSVSAWRGGMLWQIRTLALQIPSKFLNYLRTRPNSFGMTNGFVALTHLLLLPVGFEVQRLDPSPLLRRHYPSSSLVQDGPSQCSALDFSPRSFYYLSFYLGIGTTGSHSSTQEPGSDSRPLYAGRRPPSNQVSGRLVPGVLPAPGFGDS